MTKGNTEGSRVKRFLKEEKLAYILGLWSADGYFRSSSVGFSNTNPSLISSFLNFLSREFNKDRLRLRIYYPINQAKPRNLRFVNRVEKTVAYPMKKCKQISYHLYVNSRPLLREFRLARKNRNRLTIRAIPAYFAGRFDGDGCINQDLRRDCRIVYSQQVEAETDRALLEKINFKRSKVYHYRSAGTYCLYISRLEAKKFVDLLTSYSFKIARFLPRRDFFGAKLKG